MANTTPNHSSNHSFTWHSGPVPYNHLNTLGQRMQDGNMPTNPQDMLDLAEYLVAGELESGPDNGVAQDVLDTLWQVWDLLVQAHRPLGLRDPYYFPTS